MSIDEVRQGAIEAAKRGATAVFINCTAAPHVAAYVHALRDAGVTVGAYAKAWQVADKVAGATATRISSATPS